MSTPSVWTETATVRSHEVTPHGTISVPALCTHLQEAAGRHADALGVSIRRLWANDRAWVLAHLSMEIEQLPDWGDEVVVETWPSGLEGLHATREFVLRANGAPALRASSAWLVFDLEKRRPARPPRSLRAIELPDRPPARPHDWADLSRPERADHTRTFAVRYHDLDVNRHVNNVRIAEWALETLPPEIHDTFWCTTFSLQFMAETRLHDSIRAVAQVESDGDDRRVRHVLRRADDDHALAVAHTRWSSRANTH